MATDMVKGGQQPAARYATQQVDLPKAVLRHTEQASGIAGKTPEVATIVVTGQGVLEPCPGTY
ncbi:hypothetical protein GCM10020227_53800 [Streptomyces flavovirens]